MQPTATVQMPQPQHHLKLSLPPQSPIKTPTLPLVQRLLAACSPNPPTDTELGGGLLGKLKLYRSLHLFGQLIAGNQAFQDALGPQFTWRTGPLLLLEDNLMVALIVDVEHRDTPTVITSLAASKQF